MFYNNFFLMNELNRSFLIKGTFPQYKKPVPNLSNVSSLYAGKLDKLDLD